MQLLDWLIVLVYMGASLALGVWLARRASGSMEDFFVSGRQLTWWLAGTSMAATTFSIDTPLYVAGVVGTRGIAGNWEWWCFIFAHCALIYVFARLWRRSEVVTDAEIIEMRYGGTSAAWLRGIKAFLFAVPINCIGMGYAMLAATKVVTGLGILEDVGIQEGETVLGLDPKLLTVIGLSAFVLLYAGFSGLWGVVATDFFQFFLGLLGAVVVAVYAISDPRVGGLSGLVTKAQALTDFDALAFTPFVADAGGFLGIGMSAIAGISFATFVAYVGLQWWTFRRSDGGGEFIQRLISVKDEAEAEKATWLFNVMNYVVRTWPWVLVALAALVLYPTLEDKELGYPMMMLDFLPVGVLGLVVASLIAAFMSTISTSINWGASYLTNDLYRRFIRPDASQAQLVLMGRVFSVLITALAAVAAYFATDVRTVFRLVIAVGTGPGVVLILRWFWWRINAWAELAAMLGGFLAGIFVELNVFGIAWIGTLDFGGRLFLIVSVVTVLWVAVNLLTRPEPEAVLEAFYRKVRPGGPGWRRQRAATGLPPRQALGIDVLRTFAAAAALFGLMFGVGGLLLLRPAVGVANLAAAAAAFALLVWLRGKARAAGEV
ncbi:MAG TPA: sodium:solute symporter family protein [Rubricoccaceae bacterium]|nr:sodium:solute symporter family protein [Rubricoccaceae bacterium]